MEDKNKQKRKQKAALCHRRSGLGYKRFMPVLFYELQFGLLGFLAIGRQCSVVLVGAVAAGLGMGSVRRPLATHNAMEVMLKFTAISMAEGR